MILVFRCLLLFVISVILFVMLFLKFMLFEIDVVFGELV